MAQRPDIRERFESQGTEVLAGTGEDLAALIERETKLYAGIIKARAWRRSDRDEIQVTRYG